MSESMRWGHLEKWRGFRFGPWAISGRAYLRNEWDRGWQVGLLRPHGHLLLYRLFPKKERP